MFLKRERELKQLAAFLDSDESVAAMIYGIRQIGKSSLIIKAVENKPDVLYFQCLEAPIEENLIQLARKASLQLGIPLLASDDAIAFFNALKAFGKRFIIVLDEYQYLKQFFSKGSFDSYMQSIIDSLKGSGIKIILSGSYVTEMKELLDRGNPLFNRFQLVLHLKEMDYFDASAFYPDLSPYDKIAFYSIFGGSPNALSLIDPAESLEGNIRRLLLDDNAPLIFYVENTLFAELRKAQAANAVLNALRNSKFRFNELNDRVKGIEEKNLNRQLKVLIDIEAIEKVSPINTKDDRRKTFYTICSNLVRFYYAYLFSSRDELKRLGANVFYRMYIEPSINTFISYRAEAIARAYFTRLSRNDSLGDVLDIGTYWYDDKASRKSWELDCVIKRPDSYDVYEVKYLKSPISSQLIAEEYAKAKSLRNLRIGRFGIVSATGFEENAADVDMISGEDLYSESLK